MQTSISPLQQLLDAVTDPVVRSGAPGLHYANAAWRALALSLAGDENASPEQVFAHCVPLRTAEEETARGAVFQVPDGRVFERRVFQDDGVDVFWLRDISASWRMGQEKRHLGLLYRTLSLCNQALVRAEDEVVLAQAICDNLLKSGEFCAAWVYLGQGRKAPELVAQRISDAAAPHLESLLARIHPLPQQLQKGAATGQPLSLVSESAHQADAAITMELYPLGTAHHLLGYLVVAADPVSFSRQSEFGLLRELAGDLDFGISTLRAGKRLDRLRQAVRQAAKRERVVLEAMIAALAGLVEKRDPYTAGHQRRVARLASLIARRLGLPQKEIEGLALAATIHDIGKIGVPIEILVKSSALSPAEFALVKQHPVMGAEIVAGIDFPWPVADLIRHHHEKLDGSGYPDGLAGDAIPLPVRILTVADVVEAMMNHRPYRPALGLEAALGYLAENRGRLFDPAVVDACADLLRNGEFALD